VSSEKTAEAIKTPFELWSLGGPLKHTLDRGAGLPMERGDFGVSCPLKGRMKQSRCHLGW